MKTTIKRYIFLILAWGKGLRRDVSQSMDELGLSRISPCAVQFLDLLFSSADMLRYSCCTCSRVLGS